MALLFSNKRGFMMIKICLGLCMVLVKTAMGRMYSSSPAPKLQNLAWSYNGFNSPPDWPTTFPTCNGEEQSPINIVTKKAQSLRAGPIPKMKYKYYNLPAITELHNSGHIVKLRFSKRGDATVTGGLLGDDTYTAMKVEFHWGSHNNRGSEHTIDGVHFPMEIHIINYNLKYKSYNEAVISDSGIVVLAIFAQIVSDRQDHIDVMDIVVSNLWAIRFTGDTIRMSPPIALADFLPKNKHYFFYDGGLTSPDCDENVSWVVFKEPVSIHEGHITEFRRLLNGNGHSMSNNYRPVQKVYRRKVLSVDND